ncbi:TolC family protein [Sideroxydans lithotrophicus]|uniref:Outer membrane efflux protein n=1 Tax=Sideroxydans lithotrophicus (strain ES-1) TaxID=580332 RepID=D5CT06_SIDLE|nr:TolC family protein [Sideroxydans lithotrophicus]ADE12092.1 outer membrane efflux protein [Sideroxydans lithotrophicus ES-1]
MKIPLSVLSLLCALWLTPAIAAEGQLHNGGVNTGDSGADELLGSNLAGLLDYAREHNPELAATRYEAEAAQQRTESAGALPDPVLRTELMDITNKGSTSPRLLPSQTGSTRYTLMQSVPWYGRRDLQRDVADAQASKASGQVAASWSDLATRIKQTYAMHYFATNSEQLAQQTLALLGNLEQIAQTRYANGLGQQQDVIRVQVEKTMLRSELISLEEEGHHTHARLNALLSRPVNAPLADPVQLRPMPSAAKLDETTLLERLRAQNPQLRIAEANIQASEKTRDLAYNNRYPGFTLGVAPNQSGSAVRSWDLMVEFNIPLQQSSRRSQEHEAEALLSASNARKAALLDQTQAELSENLDALKAAQVTEALIATRLLPQADLTYQSALVGYQNGKVDFAMLIEAQKQILKARQQQQQARTDMQLRLADIEKLLGEEL